MLRDQGALRPNPQYPSYHADAFKRKDCRAKEQRVGLPWSHQGEVAGVRDPLEKMIFKGYSEIQTLNHKSGHTFS